jgi:TolB-like protein
MNIMFRKTMVLVVFLALAANYTVFSQAVAIDAALSNAVKEIAASVPQGTKIAVLNMSSDYGDLSDYIIDELIVNLVNTRAFQVVPRSTVELALARREFAFQMSGDVSDESQKRLGQFLGAGAIVSGSITRDSANSYRLVVNAIDLESFTYQTSYRISIQNNKKMKELVTAAGGGAFNEDFDYTTGQRIGMGALNIFGGAGSLMNGHKSGWVTLGLEAAGLIPLLFGFIFVNDAEDNKDFRNKWIGAGSALIGTGVVFGFVVPFFHHKPDNTRVSQNNLPFNLELVSSNNQEINGLRMSYNMKF